MYILGLRDFVKLYKYGLVDDEVITPVARLTGYVTLNVVTDF